MARPQSEKDKDQLFRLRAEVQSYLLVATPDITSDSTSNEFAVPNGLNGGSTKSPAGGTGLGRAHSDQSGHSQDSIRRKPSPVWNGDQDGVMGEMMETVGQVWGVAREVMKKDVAGAQRSGPLDQVGFSPAASR